MRALILSLLVLSSCSEIGSVKDFTYYQEKAEDFKNTLSSITFETTPEEIEKNIDQALQKANNSLAVLIKIDPKERTFKNTIGALDDIFNEFDKVIGRHYLLNSVSPVKALRNEATNSINKNTEWYTKIYFRDDLYQAVSSYVAKGETLTGEKKILMDDLLLAFKKNGFEVSAWKRKQLQKTRVERRLLQTTFSNNVKNYDKKVIFTKEELTGVPQSALSVLNKEEKGAYSMNPRLYSNYSAIGTHAIDASARKKALVARWSVAQKENTRTLTKIIKLRAKEARILGYKHYADYKVQDKMVKTGEAAINFMKELSLGLEDKFKKETETLRLLKAAKTGDKTAVIEPWDMAYYKNILLKEKYTLDLEKLRVYFKMENVLYGMFEVYEKIFGILIERAIAPSKWVDDLQFFVVSDKKTREPLGTLYLDLYPREGKYTHFAQFTALSGKRLSSGKMQRPISVLVCNFPKPNGSKPSLLKFTQVETLFHEFGHALHNILSKTEYAANHGTAVSRDFVEAPSQMLEFWVRDKKVLDMFAWDYRDRSKKIDPDFLERLTKAEKATIARGVRGQIAYSMIDLVLHTRFKENDYFDISRVTNSVLGEYIMAPPEGTSFIASFGHVAGGYAAGYYGYQWSLAIAHDFATVFDKSPDGYLDVNAGMRLRKEIYEVGKRRDVQESIEAFLGRNWNLKAYLKHLGI